MLFLFEPSDAKVKPTSICDDSNQPEVLKVFQQPSFCIHVHACIIIYLFLFIYFILLTLSQQ